MKIDYVSDLHLDFWATYMWEEAKWQANTESFLYSMMPVIRGDVCVVSGDISNHSIQTAWVIDFFAARYEKVFIVWGNHDYYLVGNASRRYKTSQNRIEAMESICRKYAHVCILKDYTVHEWKGVRFAGATNWYTLISPEERLFFHEVSNDSVFIKSFKIAEAAQRELFHYDQLEPIDVLVTHIPPIWTPTHAHYGAAVCYYNGLTAKADYHIFGHSHQIWQDKQDNCQYLAHGIGYPREQLVQVGKELGFPMSSISIYKK